MTQVEGETAIHEISGTKCQRQKERELSLRAKEAIALRHIELEAETQRLAEDRHKFQNQLELLSSDLLPDLGELWKLFDDSHYLADGARMKAAAIQLDRIRKDWIQSMRKQNLPK